MTRVAATMVLIAMLSGLVSAARTLEVFFIDVEGGQATLILTPAGQSLLIDAGYGGRGGRDPARILAAAREARINRIDYLLVTHFHPDHAGGVAELAAAIPIGTFIDYGEPMGTDRMATGAFRAYEAVRSKGLRLQPKPGDRLSLKGIEADVVSTGGTLLSKPLSGGGQMTAPCPAADNQAADGTENFRSVGVRLRFGAFTFVDVGDLGGNTLAGLVCPTNLLGEASVYLIPHHGDADSNVPAVLKALRPRVAIMNNGVIKGGAPEVFRTLRAQQGLEDLWQLHASQNRGADNSPDPFIANVDDGTTGYWIKLTASKNGSFSVVNGRTGFTKTYSRRSGKDHR